jgi:hypothetical protein
MPDALTSPASLETLLRLAGVCQLILVAASPAIPRVLRWKEELQASVRPLTRQLFWTYACYIWVSHLAFGLLSTFLPHLLVDGGPLARLVSGFIATWWSARLVIQFTYFDRSATPPGRLYWLAEPALVLLFVGLSSVYWLVAWAPLPRP